MNLSRVAWAAIACAIVAPAHAQDEQVQRGPRADWVKPSAPLAVPDDATGTVFVRRQDTQVRLADGEVETYSGYRIKLLNPAALQFGNISLAWNPSEGAPVLHSLKIYRDGQVIDLTDQARFEILRREDLLELSMLTGILTAVYNVPDLRVGDELELEATTIAANQTFPDLDYGLLLLPDQVTQGRYKLGLSWAGGDAPRTRISPDIADLVTRGDGSLTLSMDNPPVFRAPKDAPPRYQWSRAIEYSDLQSWAELSRKFAGLYPEAASFAEDSPLKAEAERIAAAYPTQMGRARAALKLVQDQIRYVYVGLNAGNLTPASADETWQRRYGDCKGKTALLLALLDELGIPAEAVMVRQGQGSDDGVEDRLPSPLFFDHVLVRATIDGQAYWLDGTLPSVATPTREPRGTFHWVLPYREPGADLEELPWSPPALPDKMTLYQIDASAGFDEPGDLTLTTVTRGIEALQLYAAFSSVPRAQFESEMANTYMSSGTMDEVDSATWRFDEPTAAMIMTVSGTGPVDWDETSFGQQLVLPGGGFNPPGRHTRPSSQDGTVPYYNKPGYSCYVTTVTFPRSTKSIGWTFNSTFDNTIFGSRYYRQFERRDRSISMVRGSRTEQLEISAQEAAADNERLDDFDNSKAIIAHDAEGPIYSLESGGVPPASSEVWLGTSAPCFGGGGE